jgi:signal transduction histidine kinase/ligand-binding sensor domain-containing protein
MKNKHSKIFCYLITSLVLFISCLSSPGYAQRNYLFENISIPEGLSNSTVNYIFQDSNGFLWVSTADGLNRYDGNNIKIFKNDPNDSTTIPTNDCYAIAEDSEGFIWVGFANNIIAKYDPKNDTFQRYYIETSGTNTTSVFYTALYDSKGNLWFGSTYIGLQKFNKSKNKFEQVPLDVSNKNAQWGNIYSIVELKNGNILAADYGNGIKICNEKLNSFKPYNLKADFSPLEIQIIYEDEAGNIWFGGRDQLIKFSTSSFKIDYYDPFSLIKNPTIYDNITGIIQDQEGYIWVGIFSQGLYRVDPKTNNIQQIDYNVYESNNVGRNIISNIFGRNVINNIYNDKYGVIWLSVWGKGLTKFDPLRKPFNFYKFITNDAASSNSNFSTVIAGLKQGKEITIGTSEKGLFNFDPGNYKSNNLNFIFDKSNFSGRNINIQGLAIDNAGNRWFAYNNLGLHKIDKDNSLSTIKSPHENKTTTYYVNSIKIDSLSNIWMASRYGFEKYNPSRNQFTLLPTIMTKPISPDLEREIHKIVESREPIASILKVGEASSLEKTFTLNNNQKVLIICVGEGRMDVGAGISDAGSILNAEGKTVWSMNDLFKTFNNGGGFKNRIAIGCLNLKKGDYKIIYATDVGHSYGTWNVIPPPDSLWYGIQVLSLNDSDFKLINQMNEKEINSDKFMPMGVGTSIEFSKKLKNIVWLGSTVSGFFKYDLTTGNFKQYNFDNKSVNSLNNFINYIFEDREGIVWIATANSLLRFDPATEKIDMYNQKDGLPSNQINSILEDLEGNLWINTASGVSKLNKNLPKDNWNFVNFDAQDGLQGFTTSKANWIGKDGKIFLGGIDGFTYFYPGKINEVKPDIVIEDIKVSDVSLKSDSTSLKLDKSIMKLDELDLSYTQNNISFEFASIHFSRPGKNKILYKLEGFDNHWISTERNYVSYTNLSPGEYILKVKGSNGDGIWNEEGRSIRIIINPPWWRTTLAYTGYFFLFAFLVFGVDRFQRRRLIEKERAVAKEKELEQAKEIERAYNKLKSTQTQLIHAEKMASLGELTAGIAHEIKNPLNFVNNFSEVSRELLEDMKSELQNGNKKEAMELAAYLNQNLEKIIQHGKRADSIVKGMLLHSRGTSGEKSLTDINDLLDQYVTLAYHGLRAQDKEFNIIIEKEYDNTIEKINVDPQDISRVFLNLINNACYAAHEKKKTNNDNNFSPTLKISTKNLNEKVEIRISDNGNGIPKEIIDKIFQPFFTTKPTGEGTGLGLSLSYDIVTKVHGGNLNFISEDGKYTEFIITLPRS